MTPSGDELLRATSERRFEDACSRAAEYVASVEEAVRALSTQSRDSAELIAGALATLEESRRLALCERAAFAIRLEEVRNARRYTAPVAAVPTVDVTG